MLVWNELLDGYMWNTDPDLAFRVFFNNIPFINKLSEQICSF